jgi:hypothetical protein
MPLENGQRLGPYEISGMLGRGGMGEVYRARDTRLERTVAVKTLNPEMSAHPEFRERFVREARAISALNHANICTLYDVGQTGDLSYLVMEHIAGAALNERLKKGPMPVVEALECAAQVADALDHAHRRGVVHRDLKPSNIVLTKSGAKLLDFGIAKLMQRPGEAAQAGAQGPHTMTSQGMVVGTLHYMAPEQLQGLEVDARADLFALGAVIYEMLIGARAFDGISQATIMAKIISGEPERLTDLPAMGPPELERLLRRCLAKDPEERWQTARDLRSELKWIAGRLAQPDTKPATGEVPGQPAAARPPRRRSITLPWALAGLGLAAAAVGVPWAVSRPGDRGAAALAPMVQFAVTPPAGGALLLDDDVGGSAISPDGSRLAMVAAVNGKAVLALRSMRSLDVKIIEGSDGAAYPFWSPDSRWVGFFAGERLKKAPVAGGSPETLCEAAGPRGASWGDGVILFAPRESGPLYRVADTGGTPEAVTKLNAAEREDAHGWPQFLPGGKSFLYLARTLKRQSNHVNAAMLASPEAPVRLASTNFRAVYAPAETGDRGYLLHVRDGTLVAQAFDPAKLTLSGEVRAVAFNVAAMIESGYAGVAVSTNGILVHRSGAEKGRRLRWVGRNGALIEEAAEMDQYVTLRLSPDKSSIVVTRADSESGLVDLWLVDPVRKLRTRLTYEDGIDTSPVWSPDGSQIVFASSPQGILDLFRKPLDGAASPVRIRTTDAAHRPTDWSRDGKWIVYEEDSPQTRRDLYMIAASGEGSPETLLKTPFNEYQAQFSADGKWLAYTSDETGRPEVYVRGVRDSGTPLRVSMSGASQPRWKRDGKEIYYLAQEGKLKAAALSLNPKGKLEAAAPVVLFDLAAAGASTTDYRFDVNDDGTKFLVIAPGSDTDRQYLTVTANWHRLLQ